MLGLVRTILSMKKLSFVNLTNPCSTISGIALHPGATDKLQDVVMGGRFPFPVSRSVMYLSRKHIPACAQYSPALQPHMRFPFVISENRTYRVGCGFKWRDICPPTTGAVVSSATSTHVDLHQLCYQLPRPPSVPCMTALVFGIDGARVSLPEYLISPHRSLNEDFPDS